LDSSTYIRPPNHSISLSVQQITAQAVAARAVQQRCKGQIQPSLVPAMLVVFTLLSSKKIDHVISGFTAIACVNIRKIAVFALINHAFRIRFNCCRYDQNDHYFG
jgi:hypothetical protein